MTYVMPEQALVADFHKAFGHPIAPEPTANVAKAITALRFDLMYEELDEYADAVEHGTLVDIADALGDLLYVVLGTALVHGIDLGPVLEEIHASNMSKLGTDGKPVYREDGKILKGANFRQPDLFKVLSIQPNLPNAA